MSRNIFRQIIELVIKAQELARSVGIGNLLQPGLVREMIIADLLDHTVITSKRDADACDSQDSSIKYEYLSCKEGESGQGKDHLRTVARRCCCGDRTAA